jgi:hypothetical protein
VNEKSHAPRFLLLDGERATVGMFQQLFERQLLEISKNGITYLGTALGIVSCDVKGELTTMGITDYMGDEDNKLLPACGYFHVVWERADGVLYRCAIGNRLMVIHDEWQNNALDVLREETDPTNANRIRKWPFTTMKWHEADSNTAFYTLIKEAPYDAPHSKEFWGEEAYNWVEADVNIMRDWPRIWAEIRVLPQLLLVA